MTDEGVPRRGRRQLVVMALGVAAIAGGAMAFVVFANNPAESKANGNGGATPIAANDANTQSISEEDIGGGMSRQERLELARRAQEELRRWQTFRAPRDPDERFQYMRDMEQSIGFFVEHNLHSNLYSFLEQREPRHRDDPNFLVLFGFLIAQSHDPNVQRRALQYLERAARLDPNFAYGLYVSGAVRVLLQQARVAQRESIDRQQLELAVNHLQRAVQRRPSLGDAHRAIAMANMFLGQPGEAMTAIERAIDLEPNEIQNWHAYLQLLHDRGIDDPQAIERRLVAFERQVSPRLRFLVYGMLFDHQRNAGQFTSAYEFLVDRALPIALANPDELTTIQWRQLYAEAAVISVQKAGADYPQAFRYLDNALQHCREHGLQMLPVVERYAAIVVRMIEAGVSRGERTRRIRGLVEAVFESLRVDSLSPDERGKLVQILVRIFGIPDLHVRDLNFDRTRLWDLTLWLFDTAEDTQNIALFDVGLSCLSALLPDHDAPIDSSVIEGVSRSDVARVQRALIGFGLMETDWRLALPTRTHLAQLLIATGGQLQDEFAQKAREILDGPTSEDGNARMANVTYVLRRYPMPELGRPLLTSMQRFVNARSRAHCERLFAQGHAALNAMVEEPFRKDWQPSRRTSLEQYQELIDEWRMRLP